MSPLLKIKYVWLGISQIWIWGQLMGDLSYKAESVGLVRAVCKVNGLCSWGYIPPLLFNILINFMPSIFFRQNDWNDDDNIRAQITHECTCVFRMFGAHNENMWKLAFYFFDNGNINIAHIPFMEACMDFKKDTLLSSNEIQQGLLSGNPHWASLVWLTTYHHPPHCPLSPPFFPLCLFCWVAGACTIGSVFGLLLMTAHQPHYSFCVTTPQKVQERRHARKVNIAVPKSRVFSQGTKKKFFF